MNYSDEEKAEELPLLIKAIIWLIVGGIVVALFLKFQNGEIRVDKPVSEQVISYRHENANIQLVTDGVDHSTAREIADKIIEETDIKNGDFKVKVEKKTSGLAFKDKKFCVSVDSWNGGGCTEWEEVSADAENSKIHEAAKKWLNNNKQEFSRRLQPKPVPLAE